ncbi:MAG: 50S ribosomal protein L23 [candidate division Zixibacteria bacterium]|nr:50S ribosomal protein L23 [candidate division Zixibacteria bacterium]MBU1471451.1 50S ribosomal protein L23 [candidate division Zixibacteria bacterium]MBU2625633.1 50S ribosomal protein L23 [candidate division Zixibacteria bacterium]
MRSAHSIVKSHIATEKSHIMRDQQNCYVFEVESGANKIAVRRAIEELFNVKVKDVTTMNVRGKMKRLGRFVGKKPNWKKAIVTLAKGEAISQLENI